MMIRNILLVEDNRGDILLTEEAFREAAINAKFTIANTAEAALQLLQDKESVWPDLVLLDINLPGINGNELLLKLKSDEQLKTIPVIVLSTSDAEKEKTTALQNGAQGYIVKPIDIDKFKNILSGLGYTWPATG